MPEVVAVPDAPDVGDAVRPAGVAVCSVLPACEAQPVTKTASTRQQILRKGLSPKLLLPWRVFRPVGQFPFRGRVRCLSTSALFSCSATSSILPAGASSRRRFFVGAVETYGEALSKYLQGRLAQSPA